MNAQVPGLPPFFQPDDRSGAPAGLVVAVVVTYAPDPCVAVNLQAVLAQADRVVVVDNGSTPEELAPIAAVLAEAGERAELVRNTTNRGLAAAQNQGIHRALALAAVWVLLLDQDSQPDDGMVRAMLDAHDAAPERERIGLVAAHSYDPIQSLPTRFLLSSDGCNGSIVSAGDSGTLDGLLFAIASGSLIPAAVLRTVGGMREEFFIDYVDVEFSLRLRRHGYRIIAAGAARMRHRLGAYEERRLLWRVVAVTHHSAWRRYHQYRNRVRTLRLYGRVYPAFWRWEARAIAVDLVRIALFERDRPCKYLSLLRGVLAGLGTGLKQGPGTTAG